MTFFLNFIIILAIYPVIYPNLSPKILLNRGSELVQTIKKKALEFRKGANDKNYSEDRTR